METISTFKTSKCKNLMVKFCVNQCQVPSIIYCFLNIYKNEKNKRINNFFFYLLTNEYKKVQKLTFTILPI